MNNKTSSRSTGRVTLKDVAERAGVSPISVSRAIKNPDRVSEKRRNKIIRAINDLGYIPNQAARALASSESKIISVIFPSLSNSVFPDVLEGIHDVLMPAGYRIILANSHYSTEEEDQLVDTMLEQNPDAIILTGVDQSEKTHTRLSNINIPVVQLMDLCDAPIDINIGISHFDAGYKMTCSLFNKGYQNIGFIGAGMDKRSQRRLKGYQHAVREYGNNPDQFVLTSLSNTSFQCGAELMTKLTSSFTEIDALFFSNDDLAAGAIFECQRRGIQIPEQLAIVGFNDLNFSNAINPTLTTISVPRYDMGKQAAECLLKRLTHQDCLKKIKIQFSIIERESCR